MVDFFCLAALTPLEEDETVFTVPRTSVLCVENSELFEKLREELTALAPWLVFLRAHIKSQFSQRRTRIEELK